MNQILCFRFATPEDTSRLALIAFNAYQHYVPLMKRKPAPMLADYAEHVESDICFVASVNKLIVAFAVLVEKVDGWWLEIIATDPAQQNKGAGAELLANCEKFLRAEGVSYYQLYTNEVMSGPYDWYIRSGFVETRRGTQDGFARIFMRKEL